MLFSRHASRPNPARSGLQPRGSADRRRRLSLESLEGRIAPAVAGILSLSGQTLTFTGLNVGGGNTINVSTSGSSLVINDTAGTLLSVVPGFSGTGTSTLTGGIPSGASAINIQGVASADTVNLAAGGSLVLSNNALTVTARTVNVDNVLSARSILLNDSAGGTNVNTSTFSTMAGGLTFNGNVTVTNPAVITVAGGNVALNGNTSAQASLTINDTGGNVTSTGTISAPSLTITDTGNVTLDAASVAGPVSVTADGAITLNGAVDDTGSTVLFVANAAGVGSSNFTMNYGGSIGGTPSAVTIDVNNVTGTGSAIVGAITTAAGGAVTIDTVAGGAAGGPIIDANGPGVMNLNTGAGGTAMLTAGPGGINLDTDTGSLSALTTGAPELGQVAIRNAGQPLTLGPVNTADGPINISNNNALTLSGGLHSGGADEPVTLTTTVTGGVSFHQPASSEGTFSVTSAGSITQPVLGTVITAPTITLSATTGIGVAGGQSLGVSTGRLNSVHTGTGGINITIASNATFGPVTVGFISDTASAPVSIVQTGGQSLTQNGGASLFQGAPVLFENIGGDLIVGGTVWAGSGANALTDETVGSGNIIINTGGNGAPLGTGNINVISAGTITQNGDGTAFESATVTLAATSGIGTPGQPINVAASTIVAGIVSNGSMFIHSQNAGTTNFGNASSGVTNNGTGNIVLTSAGPAILGTATSSVATLNGSVSVNAAGLLTVNNVNTSPGNGLVTLTTSAGGNVQLAANGINAGAGTVTINASGAITGGTASITASTVNLTGTSIGTAGTPLGLAASTVDATSSDVINISNALAAGTVATALTGSGPGAAVTFAQSGGASLSASVNAQGSVTLSNAGANLTATSVATTAGGVSLSTAGSGNTALGAISAPGQSVTINSAVAITNVNVPATLVNIKAATLILTAAAGIGVGAAITTQVPSITASNGANGIAVTSELTGNANPVTFNQATTTNGNVVLHATSPATIGGTGVVSTSGGSVFVTDTAGSITVANKLSSTVANVTLTAYANVSINAASTVLANGNITITSGTSSLASALQVDGKLDAVNGTVALDTTPSSPTTFTVDGTVVASVLTITGGSAGNNISLTARVVTTFGVTMNGGAGTDNITFDLAAGSAVGGDVQISGGTSTATFNVTDPLTGEVGGTFTIDFGAGHVGSDRLNLFPVGADVAAVTTTAGVPTGVTFTGGTGYSPWVLTNFNLGIDQIPGYGY